MKKIINQARLLSGQVIAGIGFAILAGSIAFAYSGGGVKQVCESGANCNYNESGNLGNGILGGTTNYDDLAVSSLSVSGATTLTGAMTLSGELQAQTVISGGSVYTTSSLNSTSLTAAQVCDNSVILLAPGTLAINVTLPTTSTLYSDCLDTNGDSKTVVLRNTTTTASAVMTLVAGTGIVSMSSPTSTAPGGDLVSTDEQARIVLTRLGDAAGQISAMIEVFKDAD